MTEWMTAQSAKLQGRWRKATRWISRANDALAREDGGAGSFTQTVKRMTNHLIEGIAGENAASPTEGEVGLGYISGNSAAISIPDLLGFIEVLAKTGVLQVALPDETISIEAEDGLLLHAFSDNSPSDARLGEILVEQGAIGREGLEDYLNADAAYLGRLGELLERGALITEEQLRSALDAQIQALFHRLFAAEHATFTFTDSQPDRSREGMQLNITRLLLESARVHDESQPA